MKNRRRYLLAVACLAISLTSVLHAQQVQWPGYLKRGAQHGFVPKHLKVQHAQAATQKIVQNAPRLAPPRNLAPISRQPSIPVLPTNPFAKPIAKANPFARPIDPLAKPIPASDPFSQSMIQQATQIETIVDQPPAILDPISTGSVIQQPLVGQPTVGQEVISAPLTEQPIIGQGFVGQGGIDQPVIESPIQGFQAGCDTCSSSCGGASCGGGCGDGLPCNCWVRRPGSPCTTPNPCYGPMYWIGVDFLFWGIQSVDAPALVTTSPEGTDRELAGVLGEDTSVVFGNTAFHEGLRLGHRFNAGMWLTQARTAGIQFSYLSIESDNESFSGEILEFPVLARPFFNTQLNEEDSRLINFTGLVNGRLDISASSDFHSLEVMMFRPLSYPTGYLRLLGGYRHLGLDEFIRFEEFTTSLESPTDGTTFDLFDAFRVENDFHGPQIAAHYVRPLNRCWSYDISGKIAVGGTRTVTTIDGERIISVDANDTTTQSGGLLALDTNIGTHTDVKLSSVLEFGLNLRRTYRNGLHFTVGYNFLHWSNVARAVEQIDMNINRTQIAPDTLQGQPRPRNGFKRGGMWAQGLTLGLEYRF